MATQVSRSQQSSEFLAKPDIHDEWRSDYLNPYLEPFYELAFARVRQALGVQPGSTLLDAGCGSCVHAARFARAGVKVVGVDFSQAALADARRALERQGLGGSVELHQADLRKLPFESGTFPAISCWGVLMHVPDLEPALAELVRVLAPGGRLSIMENNAHSWHVRWFEPSLRALKRVLGRKVGSVAKTERGLEEWRAEGLMVRKLDPDWFQAAMDRLGLRLVTRFSGQFTEMYTTLPTRLLKRAVYRFNQRWLEANRSPARAMGNIFIFEKTT